MSGHPSAFAEPTLSERLGRRQQTGNADVGWWRGAVVYQVYVRSFADGNGDGIGDLSGVRARLPYLRDLGVNAIWFSPWYRSPMTDGGYDVVDYREIEPVYGTLDEADLLIAEAMTLGIRTIVDIVPNHVSKEHAWFRAALAADPASAERSRFWFRPGKGTGEEPPNDWVSYFGGPAWTRSKNPDGTPGDWYLHLFTAGQPDLNWGNPEVRREHENVLRFWFDRGVAGIRIDSAVLLAKDPELPDVSAPGDHPYVDRPELHDVYREWRQVANSYSGGRILVGELWLPDPGRLAAYLRPDELHTAFNFESMCCPWEAGPLRASIATTLAAHEPVGAPAVWVLSNHDVTRPVTRYGREDTSFTFENKRTGTPTDLALGHRRARAAALLAMALPGAVYVYQGDELGLAEVEDIPASRRQDPVFFKSGGLDPGRDGCRVPLPWAGQDPPYAFSPADADAQTWLPQPASWAELTVQTQEGEPASMLTLYRTGLRLRREEALGAGPMTWLDAGDEVLAFRREDTFACIVNLAAAPADLPPHTEVLLTSVSLENGRLPSDAAAWLRLPVDQATAPTVRST